MDASSSPVVPRVFVKLPGASPPPGSARLELWSSSPPPPPPPGHTCSQLRCVGLLGRGHPTTGRGGGGSDPPPLGADLRILALGGFILVGLFLARCGSADQDKMCFLSLPMEWLHRNNNYVPLRLTGYSTTTTFDHSTCMTEPSTIATVNRQGGLLLRWHSLLHSTFLYLLSSSM